MVSSYPYPPQFLDWMRELFKNPQPFINSALREIQGRGFSGFNLDFEPTVNGSPEDAKSYAKFLSTFADALHKINKILTIDVASWNSIWNLTQISHSNVDRIFTMDTYTGNFTTYERVFKKKQLKKLIIWKNLELDYKYYLLVMKKFRKDLKWLNNIIFVKLIYGRWKLQKIGGLLLINFFPKELLFEKLSAKHTVVFKNQNKTF